MRLLHFILLILLLMPGLHAQENINERNELLWEISGNGLKQKSYLFGSFHSNDKRVFRLGDTVYYALKQAGAVALETNLHELFGEIDTRMNEVTLRYDNEGNPYTSSRKASKTYYGDEDGMPQFLDAFFQNYAFLANKHFYPLEKVEDQLNIFNDLPEVPLNSSTLQRALLTNDNIINVYLTGDVEGLNRLLKTSLTVYPGLYEKMITQRNRKMADGLDTLMLKESVFCAVGAGHLGGQFGIINLLRAKGYKLRPVTYSLNSVKEKKEVIALRSYYFSNDSIGIKAIFPGKPFENVTFDGSPLIIYRELGQGNTYSLEWREREEGMSLEKYASIYIPNQSSTQLRHLYMDDGNEVIEGLAFAYPEGLCWSRVFMNEKYLFIIKSYGGNKFMNSNRPFNFFNGVGFE